MGGGGNDRVFWGRVLLAIALRAGGWAAGLALLAGAAVALGLAAGYFIGEALP